MLMRALLRQMTIPQLFHHSVYCASDADELSIEPVWCPPVPASTARSVSHEVPLIADPLGIVFSAAALNEEALIAAALKRVPTPQPSSMQPHPTYVCDDDEVLAEGADEVLDENANYVGMFYKG